MNLLSTVGRLELQRVKLVLLVLAGSREGENEFVEFPSLEDAITHGRQINSDPRRQLEGIEDASGKTLVTYDHLRELCCPTSPSGG